MTDLSLPSTGRGLRSLAAKGFVLIGAAQAYKILIGFASNVILIRILAPSDFGLIAMVAACLALINLIQDLGLNQASIQRQQISQRQVSALFWVSVAFSAALALVFAASAPAITWFFREERVNSLVLAFSVLVLITGFQSQHIALLNRNLRFTALAAIEVAVATTTAVVGVALAWLTESYWALFAASAASTVVRLLAAWFSSGWRPGWPSFDGEFKEIFLFGSGISGFNIVNYFSRNADNLLIGRTYGSEQLGYYDRAYRLLLFPLHQIQGPLGRVMLPILSRLQTEPERYKKAYSECVSAMMLVTQPGLLFLIVFAGEVFMILFGPRWQPAVPIFQWLGVAGLHQIMTTTLGWLFVSQGRGGDFFKIGLYASVTTVLAFLVGLKWGPVGVAAAYTITEYLLRLPFIWASAGKRGPVSVNALYMIALPHVVATLAAASMLGAVRVMAGPTTLIECTSAAITSYLVYSIVLLLFPTKRRIILQHGREVATLRFRT